MGKHSKPPTSKEADELVDKMFSNTRHLARFLGLMDAVRVIDRRETQLHLSDRELEEGSGEHIVKYIDSREEEITDLIESGAFNLIK